MYSKRNFKQQQKKTDFNDKTNTIVCCRYKV